MDVIHIFFFYDYIAYNFIWKQGRWTLKILFNTELNLDSFEILLAL